MNQFHEETNKSHDAETDGRGNGNLLEFSSIGFRATLHQSQRILGEQTGRLTEFDNLIHFFFILLVDLS